MYRGSVITRTILRPGLRRRPGGGPSLRAANRGTVRFRDQGRKRGLFRHETEVLYDSSGHRSPFSRISAPFAPSVHQHAEETPGQGLASISPQGRRSRQLSFYEEHRRTEPRFDPRSGRKICPGPEGMPTRRQRYPQAEPRGSRRTEEARGVEGRLGRGGRVRRRSES